MDNTNRRPEHETMSVFGMNLSDEDLTDLFVTCVFCFNYAIGRKPTATEVLELSVLRLRLTRWGEAVKIYDKPALRHADPDDLYEARQALVGIIILFGTGNQAPNVSVRNMNGMDNNILLLQQALGSIASERAGQGNSLLGPQHMAPSRWSKEKSKSASKFIDSLESLFGSRFLRGLCASERLRINNENATERLRAVASNLDPWMAKTEGQYNKNIFVNVTTGNQLNGIAVGSQFIGGTQEMPFSKY